jgi:hypothetical protein
MTRYTVTWYAKDGTPHAAVNLTPGALAELSAGIVFDFGYGIFSTRQDFLYSAEECEAAMAVLTENML